MAQYMCMDSLFFLMFDVHRIDRVFEYSHFKEYSIDMAKLILESTKAWADQDFYPYYREMDEKPVYFKDGIVHSHQILKKVYKTAGENGFLGGYFDSSEGGSQIPFCISNGNNHILEAANNHIPGYLGLTNGAAHLITSFGKEDLIKKYVPKMLSGDWGGTMALTEPQAGSSLSDITTKAKFLEEEKYAITGQKIFISGGDHQASENIIHLVLARIEGAPAGTKGISLFVVPKYLPDNGKLLDNNVETVGDFQKLGQRGYSTVHLVFGEKETCYGFLVGKPNEGLQYMFQMMNGARIDVGLTAASVASAAYYHSLQYARERKQGRRLTNKGHEKPSNDNPVSIIEHPDVKRMLYRQKAIVEGSLSLLIECSFWQDISKVAEGSVKEKASLLLELLTPVAKTYPSEKGLEAVSTGLQILGGYGYCLDFPLQQYFRDIRIMSIYEGTTGIQSLDLLGRKIPLDNGKAIQYFWDDVKEVLVKAQEDEQLKAYAEILNKAVFDVKKVLNHLMPLAIDGKYEQYLADATIFMEMFSTLVIGYQWLKIGLQIENRTASESNAFYYSKWQTFKFFYKYEMPNVQKCLHTILNQDQLTLNSGEDFFT